MTNLKQRLGWAILIGWLGLSTFFMYRFVFADYGEFDPGQQWLGNQSEPSLTQLAIQPATGFTLIKVSSASCSCNSYLASHLADLHSGLEQPLEVVERSIAEVEASGLSVPATPMALLYDGDSLVYAGPFATGPFCASENSLIRDILKRQTRLAGSYLNGLVKACRCLND
ncbi:hypothetical protein CWE12_00800 [Aliidiomarina sedimenti]|uniref:DUF6436 domain-containing protein n=1 Tax=Aliidiomarina sedimenti TaxID=1933879 RepID=A0ABY0C264_9GAMM|nr:DUF6436 domain-containing protein [Aliidiomarina sedimenti]RUO31570.1 hypothetical protein CWE12_00800 [Aliidiomarina sedimenti]